MKKIYRKIDRAFRDLYFKQIDAKGLALFRILYSVVLLSEIIRLFYFRHLMFDPVPYIEIGEMDVTIPFLVWMLSAAGILFGAFTRTSAIINYVCSLFFIGSLQTFEYHMFIVYMGINFLLMFIPVSRQWSLDRLFLKLKHSNTKFFYIPPRTVSSMAYLLPVFIVVGLIYFDSVLYKLNDHIWLHGLGIWLPASLPMITISRPGWMLNAEFLIKFLNYFVILFELVFIVIMWKKQFRWLCFIFGIGLHIGIFVEFPIPFFGAGMCAIYILVLPVWIFKKLDNLKIKHPALFFYYDAECPLCARTRIIIEHIDVLGAVAFRSVQLHAKDEPLLNDIDESLLYSDVYSVSRKGKVYSGVDTYVQVLNAVFYLKPLSWLLRLPGICHLAVWVYRKVADNRTTERCTEQNCGYTPPVFPPRDREVKLLSTLTLGDLKQKLLFVFVCLVVLIQCVISYTSDGPERLRQLAGLTKTRLDGKLSAYSYRINASFLGLGHHGVFLTGHFAGYNHIARICYCAPNGVEMELPIIDKFGMPGSYNSGSNWCKWTFGTMSPVIDMQMFKDGARSFTAFWAYKHHVNLKNDSFKVYVKKIPVPAKWEKDFLKTHLDSSGWINAGYISWRNGKFSSDIVDIGKL